MATYSNRMALIKPAGSEARSNVQLNTNADLLDKFMPCILVNDGVTPPTGDLYDGALVKERTSGIIWEARKNGGGTFDKVYVQYPFQLVGQQLAQNFTSGTTPFATGITSVTTAQCVNAGAGNLSGVKCVAPIKGLYEFKVSNRWAVNATGLRSLTTEVGGSNDLSREDLRISVGASFTTDCHISRTILMSASQTIVGMAWQNSGGALNVDTYTSFTLLQPVQ